jgi:hypothetical protein
MICERLSLIGSDKVEGTAVYGKDGLASGDSLASRRISATSNRVSVEPLSVSQESGILTQRHMRLSHAGDRSATGTETEQHSRVVRSKCYVTSSLTIKPWTLLPSFPRSVH